MNLLKQFLIKKGQAFYIMVGESINPLAIFTQNLPQFSASSSLNRNSEGTNINQTNITQGENTQITDTNVLNTLAPFYERNRIDTLS